MSIRTGSLFLFLLSALDLEGLASGGGGAVSQQEVVAMSRASFIRPAPVTLPQKPRNRLWAMAEEKMDDMAEGKMWRMCTAIEYHFRLSTFNTHNATDGEHDIQIT